MKKSIAVFLIVCLFAATCVIPAAANTSFDRLTDVKPTDWFYEGVKFVYENGIMTGVSENSFGPGIPVTRAMLVTVLYRLEGEPAVSGKCPFPDVGEDKWFTAAVTWASGKGIVLGNEKGDFRPEGRISREQFVTVLHRYAVLKDMTFEATCALPDFADAKDISGWALDAVKWACGAGLIRGRTEKEFRPQGETTRAETATILMRFLSKDQEQDDTQDGKSDEQESNEPEGSVKTTGPVSGNNGSRRRGYQAPSVTLDVNPAKVSESETVTYTVTLNYSVGGDITVALSNGLNITIPEGQTSGSVSVKPREDDEYRQSDETVAVFIKNISGSGSFDAGQIMFDETPVSVEVFEGESDGGTVVTLGVDKTSVTEGSTVNYTAAMENAPKSDITVTLDNGKTITIVAGTKQGSVEVPVRENDLYSQGDETLTVKIGAVTQDTAQDGLENVIFDETEAITVVSDDGDITAVTVTGTDLSEGGDAVFTVTLENPAQSDAVVTAKAGDVEYTANIAEGKKEGILTVPVPLADDIYKNSSALTLTLQGVTGGSFEAVSLGEAVTVNIEDTVDKTTASLDLFNNKDGSQTVTLNLTNADGAPAAAPSGGVTFIMSNGEEVTLTEGSFETTQTLKNGLVNKLSITGVSGVADTDNDLIIDYNEAPGGFFELLDFSNAMDAAPEIKIPGAGSTAATVYESGIVTGTAATTGEIALDLNGEAADLGIGDLSFSIDKDGNAEIGTGNSVVTDKGVLTVTEISAGTVKYKYELTASSDHSGGDVTESFAVKVTDPDGDLTEQTLAFGIIDDAPTAEADSGSLEEAAGKLSVDTPDNGVLSNDNFGADDSAGYHVVAGVAAGVKTEAQNAGVGTAIPGVYGKLTLNADGTYGYTLDKDVSCGEKVDDFFSYTIKDSDGDFSTATLTISVTGDDRVPSINAPAPAAVHETSKETTDGSITLSLNGEAGTLKIGERSFALNEQGSGSLENVEITGAYGTLTVHGAASGSVSYSYTLKDGIDNNPALTDDFTVTLEDATGDKAEAKTLSIAIEADSRPEIIMLRETSGFSFDPAEGAVYASSGQFGDSAGADGYHPGFGSYLAKFDLSANDSVYKVKFDDGREVDANLNISSGSSGQTMTLATASETLLNGHVGADGAWSVKLDNPHFVIIDNNGETVPEAKRSVFEFSFIVEDADGDIASSARNFRIGIGFKEPDLIVGNDPANHQEQFNVTGGAGRIAYGDPGGVSDTIEGAKYNICIILDTSSSMTAMDALSGTGLASRLSVAQDSIYQFIEDISQSHNYTSTYTIGVITFNKTAKTLATVFAEYRYDDGLTASGWHYSIDGVEKSLQEIFVLIHGTGYASYTNYEDAFAAAKHWFTTKAFNIQKATRNVTYFITDGEPSTNSHTTQATSYTTYDNINYAYREYKNFINTVPNVEVNTTGFGNDLNETAMLNLAMFDNTEKTGNRANKQNVLYYQESEGRFRGELVTRTYQPENALPAGKATATTSRLDLSEEFENGISYLALLDVSSDIFNIEGTAGIIFGDVLNTDMLLNQILEGLSQESIPIPEGWQAGMGASFFDQLASDSIQATLSGTTFDLMSWEPLSLILRNLLCCGFETRIDPLSNLLYLLDTEGTVLDLSGNIQDIAYDSLSGREFGDDIINGGFEADIAFGQEGNDILHGGDGNDYLYGGTGRDTIYGDDGNDSIYGGAGNDIIYGGAGSDTMLGGVGNDILVFDENDIFFDGGAGLDFLVGEGTSAIGVLRNGIASLMGFEAAIGSDTLDIDGVVSLASALSQTNSEVCIARSVLTAAGWSEDTSFVSDTFAKYIRTDAVMIISKTSLSD